jgi:hypothetical protein
LPAIFNLEHALEERCQLSGKLGGKKRGPAWLIGEKELIFEFWAYFGNGGIT